MTVTIDPSDVRRHVAVKGSLPIPRRALMVGSLGGVALLAFTFGAFSFFSGLADPRVRTKRPAMVAANMPDLKDGLPALVPGSGQASQATVLNLPKPPVEDAPPASHAAPSDLAQPALRTDTAESTPPVAEPARAAEATGSVAPPPAKLAKAAPAIENAATVTTSPKQAAVIGPAKLASPLAPAKTETVRAKVVDTRSAAVAASPMPAAETDPATAKRTAVKPVKAKVAKASASGDQASAETAPAPAAKADDDSNGFGSKLQSGMKALGGMFGGDD